MKKHLKRLFVFTMAFVACVPIGTISHEFGHIVIARHFGYENRLHYASATSIDTARVRKLQAIARENVDSIRAGKSFPREEEYWREFQAIRNHNMWIRIGGPVQTILTGTLGLCILLYRRKRIARAGMAAFDWIAVFLSLFWLRQVSNFCVGIFRSLWNSKELFSGRDDETVINWYLGLPPGTVAILSALAGLLVALFVIFRIIPKAERPVFIISGFIGGIFGYWFWFFLTGPVVLP